MTVRFLSVLVFAMICHSSLAQTSARVLKSKGRKAIIEVTSGERFQPGDELEIRFADEVGSNSYSSSLVGGRANSIAGDFAFTQSSIKTERDNVPSTDSQSSNFVFSGRYGWNSGLYEFGPQVSYDGATVDGENISSMRLGGFFEYNFIEANRPGVELVPTTGVSFEYLSATLDSSSGTGIGLSVFVGGKYYILSDSLAFTGFLTINQDTITYANNRKDSSQTTGLRVGLAQYY